MRLKPQSAACTAYYTGIRPSCQRLSAFFSLWQELFFFILPPNLLRRFQSGQTLWTFPRRIEMLPESIDDIAK